MTTPDPNDYNEENKSVAAYIVERSAWQRRLTSASADDMHNLLRTYPSLTPDTAVAIVAAELSPDDVYLRDLVNKDAVQADNWFLKGAKATARGAFTYMESAYQESPLNRGLRTGVRMWQGENPLDAYRRSGSSYLGRAARKWSQDESVNLGSGWMGQSTLAEDMPGFSEKVMASMKGGKNLASAVGQATEMSYAENGTPITEQYIKQAEGTLLTKTVDGVNYTSPVSVGRFIAVGVSTPDTVPFQAMSSLIDFSTRITMDPVDLPFRELALAAAARRTVVPRKASGAIREAEREFLRTHLGIEFTNSGSPMGSAYRYEGVAGSGAARVTLNKARIQEYADIIDRGMGIQPPSRYGGIGDQANWGAGYREARDLLDEIAQRNFGVDYETYMYHLYGDNYVAQFDETLTHEFIHSEDQYKIHSKMDSEGRRQFIIDDQSFSPESNAYLENLRSQMDEGSAELNAIQKRMEDLQEAKDVTRAEIVKAFDEQVAIEGADKVDDAMLKLAKEKVEGLQVDFANLEGQYIDAGDDFLRLNKKVEAHIDAIDTDRIVEFDATFKTGQRLMAGESTMSKVRKAAMEEAGLRNAWRPWLQPRMIEDWLHTEAGRRVIRFLTDNTSTSKQLKVLKGEHIPVETRIALNKAKTEAETIQALTPILGMEAEKLPRYSNRKVLGATMSTDMNQYIGAPLSRMGFTGGHIASNINAGWHRIGAKSVKMVLDPFNQGKSLTHIQAWMMTARATDNQIDNSLELFMRESAKRAPRMDKVYARMVDTYISQAKLHGMSDDMVEAVLRDFGQEMLDNQLYWVDAAGNQVDEVDDLMRLIYNPIKNKQEPQAMFSAVMESQTATSNWTLPNVRVIRRSTSHLHQVTQKATDKILKQLPTGSGRAQTLQRMYPDGLNDSWAMQGLDVFQGIWRDLALLRVGWPLRVIPEEMLRQSAAGYSDFITHPLSYFGLMFRFKMKNTVMGDDFKSLLTLDQLGSGQFREMRHVWNPTKQSWTTVAIGQKGYKEGLASTFLQMSGDEIGAHLARYGPEDTYVWLTTDSGRSVARRVTDAGDGNPLLDLATHAKTKQHVNRLHAFQTQHTGGAWIRKNSKGQWVDMNGEAVQDWGKLTRQQLKESVDERLIARGQPPVDTLATSHSKQFWLDKIVEETNIPVLDTIEDGLNYHIVKAGDQRLLDVIGYRTSPLDDIPTGRRVISPEGRMTAELIENIRLVRSEADLGSLQGSLDIATKLSDEFPELGIVRGSKDGGTHVWNELPDGTIIDAHFDSEHGAELMRIIRPGDDLYEGYAGFSAVDARIQSMAPGWLAPGTGHNIH